MLVALVSTNARLRADTDRAEEQTAAARSALAEARDRVDELDAERHGLEASQEVTAASLTAALARLEGLVADEDEVRRLLTEQGDTYEAAEENLDIVAASVDDASDQTAANVALLAALERCLDGATEAANALSVGDETRAFERAASVRDACATVGVALG